MAADIPALLGGPPVRPEGPPPWPLPDEEVHHALQAAYADGAWGQYNGPNATRLEDALRQYYSLDHVLLCGSGTFAVELALRSLLVGPGDEVILAAYDYPGNFLDVHALGAVPVLVDVSSSNWNLCLDRLADAVGPTCKAIIASHLHGGVIDMPRLVEFARARGLSVIEDAAQCPGATIAGRRAGTWGDAGTLSFGGSKLLSAGRGGALVTSNPAVFQRARTAMLRGNLVCPLSELQAAVVLPQLAKLDDRNARRLAAVTCLTEAIRDVPGLAPFRNPDIQARPGYYKVGYQFSEEAFGLSRATFVKAMRAEGIAFDEGFSALHIGRSNRRYRAGSSLGEADKAHRGSVVLHHPVLLGADAGLEQVAAAVRKIHGHREALSSASAASPAAGPDGDSRR